MGGAPYAPYDPADSDGVALWSLWFAIAFAGAAILYGSPQYGLLTCLIQIAIYFSTYAFPHWLKYPQASLLGVRPAILSELLGVYALALGLLLAQQKWRWWLPNHVILGTVVTTSMGDWALVQLSKWLPNNGAYLGYISTATFVPHSAWDWSRSAAQGVAYLAFVAALLLGIRVVWNLARNTS